MTAPTDRADRTDASARAASAGRTDPPPPPGPARGDWRTRLTSAPAVFWTSVAVTLAVFLAGAWERRWIADDGLIVLRTVRNLAAGNGPVFNAGERVESNTSTAWTYLVWITSEVFPYRLELVTLGLALTVSLVAVAVAMYGTRIMYLGTRAHPSGRDRRGLWFLPFGALVYVVLPPARDFATSGLETCIILAWIATMWLLMQLWARTPHREHALGRPTALVATIAFVGGLAPLVRPELAIAALALLGLLALARTSIAHLAWCVAIAATLPAVYQVWRMSFYALPYPITAVAKDAGGAKWDRGLAYLWNLLSPYTLLLPIIVCLVGVGVAWYLIRTAGPRRETTTHDDPPADHSLGGRVDRLRTRVRTTPVVTGVFALVAAVMLLYVLRVGGDFMHGRVLLPSLFLFLLPLMVLPLPAGAPKGAAEARTRRVALPVLAVAWLVVAIWAAVVSIAQEPFRSAPEQISATGIVDERQFYVQRTGHRHPVLADDYRDFPRMRAMLDSLSRNDLGGLYLPQGGSWDRWGVYPYDAPMEGMAPFEIPENPVETVVFLNLGMTGMLLPLDVTLYDTVGLANPIAAHSDRMVDGRIGHDKALPFSWFFAQTGVVTEPENYPSWLDANDVEKAKVALTCPATQELIASYTAPLTMERRWKNLLNAFSYAEYRINRVPDYEVQRCGLPMPPEVEKYPGTR